METAFELMEYALFRPVQTAALVVFLYQGLAVFLLDRRRQTSARKATNTPLAASTATARRLAA